MLPSPVYAGGLNLGGTAVSSTAAELNLLDGGTSVGSSITVANSDGIIINDGGNFTFENGTVVTTAQEFVDFVEQDYQKTIADGGEWGWNTDYAFAAYVAGSDDPEAWNQAGEWVNAQFTSSNGVYIEWYHIADGKLQNWNQTKAALPQE